jgi:hypothetical protein
VGLVAAKRRKLERLSWGPPILDLDNWYGTRIDPVKVISDQKQRQILGFVP